MLGGEGGREGTVGKPTAGTMRKWHNEHQMKGVCLGGTALLTARPKAGP